MSSKVFNDDNKNSLIKSRIPSLQQRTIFAENLVGISHFPSNCTISETAFRHQRKLSMKPLQSSIFRSFLSVACLSSFGLISTSALSGPYQVCPQARPNPYGGYGSILPICASHIPLSQAHTLSTYGVLGRPGQVGQGPKVERQTPIQGAGLVLCTPPNGYTWSDEYHGINVYAGSDRVFPRGAGDMVHHGSLHTH